ncbi:MAG TPA: hypothetical protein VFL92_01720 [Sphingomonas sp.]|nr:hypothetical protein [Sphingomonas sp.]
MGLERNEAMLLVRADLGRRLDGLEARLERRGPIGAEGEAWTIAMLAGDYGLAAAQRLAEGLAAALGRGGRGAAIGPWLERLRDAIDDATPGDRPADDAWLAAVMVRLAG